MHLHIRVSQTDISNGLCFQPEPTTWSTRMRQNFHTQASSKGANIEYAVQLSNMMGANPWFNQPHAADDDFITKFATLVKNTLRPDLKVMSNNVTKRNLNLIFSSPEPKAEKVSL